jgi:hypothetical protein
MLVGMGAWMDRLRRWFSDDKPNATCPVCGRQIVAAPNTINGPGGPWSVARTRAELIGDCRAQHGTDHSSSPSTGE